MQASHEPARHQNHTRAPQFTATVAQKVNWKNGFRDLWWKMFWATSAPGQPPIKASTCKLLSGVRHAPVCAAALSTRYAATAARLEVSETTGSACGEVPL